MLNKILLILLKVILYVIKALLNIILLPITIMINLLFPNIHAYFYYFENFFNQHLLIGIRFIREVFYNLTGINRNLMAMILIIPLTYLTFTIANTTVRLLWTIFRLWKSGKDS